MHHARGKRGSDLAGAVNTANGQSWPLVSVVIASVNGLPSIAECVDALVHQEGNVPYEVLVVDCCGDETRSELRRRFPQPQVHLIPVAGRPSIPHPR